MNDDTVLEEKQPQGFGGWFVLILIGLFASIILGTVQFFQYSEVWQYVDFGLGSLLTIDYLNTIILSIVILIFIFRKDIRFRLMYLIQTCISVVIIICLFAIIGTADGQMIGSMLGRILWTIYLFKSVRVKNTFVDKKPTEENKDFSVF